MSEPRKALQDAAVLWRLALASASDLSMAAAHALVDGLDSPSLRELAGTSRGLADFEVPELWPRVADELGLALADVSSEEGRLQCACALARLWLREGRSPRFVASEFHRHFSHDGPHLLDEITALDDQYDDYYHQTKERERELNLEVLAAIGRLLDSERDKS